MLTTWMENQNIMEYSVIPLSSIPKQYELFQVLLDKVRNDSGTSPISKGFLTNHQLYRGLEANLSNCYAISMFFPFLSQNHKGEGNLPLYAMSLDYHRIIKTILESLQKSFETEYPNHFLYGQCDTGPFDERLFATESGLCFQGVNALAIHPRYGTFGMLGLFITDLPQKVKRREPMWCRRCGKCREVCPGQAILENGQIDILRCASYLSQEKRNLTVQEEEIIWRSKKVFGCDRCQECCPENEHVLQSPLRVFSEFLLCNVELRDIEGLSNKDFLALYGNRAFSWRGRGVLERNLKLVKKRNPRP